MGVPVVALLFFCSLVADAQPKGASEIKGAPAGSTQAKKGESKTTTGEPGEEYAACSPNYSGEEIKAVEAFLAEFSQDLAMKTKQILLECDFRVNDRLLAFIKELQEEMADIEFASAEEEKEYRQEKAKEVEVQIALSKQPVDEAGLKKLVGELFDLRQKGMKSELADLEKQAEMLKKRIAERQQLKDKIVDRKTQELAGGAGPTEGEEAPTDPLAWD